MNDQNELSAPITNIVWLSHTSGTELVVETMIALANQSGGTMAIAVDNNADMLMERFTQACFAADPVLIIPAPLEKEIEGKQAVTISIPGGLPHVYAHQGRYLIRSGDNNVPLAPADLRRLILSRGDASYETTPVHGTNLEDLDWDKAREYARNLAGFKSHDVQDVLVRRGCLLRTENGLQPTHAGILLFGKDPQRYVQNSDIVAVRFPGETMSDAFSRQDIQGTLPEQIRSCEIFLKTQLQKEVMLTGSMERTEILEYPLEAARELVINAVAHRDYTLHGDNIHIYLFSNRMEVHSPGKLPGPMTISNLRDERFSRNPAIVQVLSDMNYIEKLGYGLDRVIELMQTRSQRPPDFIERDGGFHVILYRESVVEHTQAPNVTPVREPVKPDFRGIYNGQEINPRQETAIAFLLNSGKHRVTNGELKDLLPDVHPETLRRDLSDLVSKEILVKMGQKRGSYYVLKDRTER